ncbi:OLC1v1035590C1 [Oldenlandia corymbosa var. corymbosa]|uniref:poly(A)-specific ribonuclease n=1 Tax=Oldenlandia corymbosa var. corymbosa TaxID=529605 RepID=A0AAV1CTC1_OLDCO|nr:OLC1v1035590C1 [Oldenlandia corymbosa var. corymbosa]
MVSKHANYHVREVHSFDLEKEFKRIRRIVDMYPYMAIDTEYPGVVIPLKKKYRETTKSERYASLKENVDILKLIQLGLTFLGGKGNLPSYRKKCKGCIWQFTFRDFNLDEDRVTWIVFHGSYDFGYLLKLLMGRQTLPNTRKDFPLLMPDTQEDFLRLLKIFFPTVYDVEHLLRFFPNLKGKLVEISERLGIVRIENSHQVGSDSFITTMAFTKLMAYKG